MAILSIQSHVAYGHVGNRSAVFPLERLGFELWPIDTVQFSNHTGYGSWKGEVFSASHIEQVWGGVRDRGVVRDCEAVLSGYLGDAPIGEAILAAVRDVKAANPRAVYCCDPVMGDYGRGFYVRPGIPEFIRSRATIAADILTPNQFEAEMLSGIEIASIADAAEASRILQALGPRIVLITSFKPGSAGAPSVSMFLADEGKRYTISTPELPLNPAPNGAGDLTAALFLGRYLMTGDAKTALELMTDSVFSVLERTLAAKSRELKIVESQEDIAQPRSRFKAIPVEA